MATSVTRWDDLVQGEELAHLATEPAREAQLAPLPDDVHATVRDALPFDSLYLHQRDAWDAARRGEHVIVTTGTASGKTLAFNLPVLDAVSRDPKLRTLYLYPTKALAQDQARTLASFRLPRTRAAIYDGDTPGERRWQIRRWANLILTNPDMLHVGVLPHHDRWGDVLSHLRYVVVDEAHVYRGVFGSHVGNVLRRLRRIAAAYGTAPRLLMASATIGNPAELAERLTGLDDFAVIERDGSPVTKRTIAMWNPPISDAKLGTRRSVLSEAADLLAELVVQGARTIVFMKSRKAVELMAKFTQLALEDLGHPKLAERIAPYRAGYTPQQRRELERRLVQGDLLGVVST
ncbi:MAG: DEAD/DEAH box helicase, partial [Gaiellaceae bacterium]